ncbi:DapH/DapD/GlmU-related protein [Pseudovibrio sp. Ad37]|uniref:DapH/DapD/GlmU-related protein n=1 Tax=Pseudovibrio sp. Ad37 TaxID=989422 RepID=UPI0007B2549E|nr:DapH/DapD/GlmU-related protein [Pseudovibrio sp. Ad37]KZL13579.1 Virginiamycin A acetyltransferase [Pseudovibrio sp. Ad37]
MIKPPKIAETVIGSTVTHREATVGKQCEVLGPTYLEYCEIGDYSYIGPNSTVADTTIGKFTAIASNVRLGPPNHPLERVSQHRFTYTPEYYREDKERDHQFFADRRAARVTIGNDVWIGHGVTVLPGVKIGDGAILAAGAVVAKNVEPYTIVGGVPAKLIKRRFSKEAADRLIKLKWWDWPEDKIFERLPLFQSMTVERFLEHFEPA